MNEGIQDVVDSFHEMPKDEAAVSDKVDHLVHTTVETVTASLSPAGRTVPYPQVQDETNHQGCQK